MIPSKENSEDISVIDPIKWDTWVFFQCQHYCHTCHFCIYIKSSIKKKSAQCEQPTVSADGCQIPDKATVLNLDYSTVYHICFLPRHPITCIFFM